MADGEGLHRAGWRRPPEAFLVPLLPVQPVCFQRADLQAGSRIAYGCWL